MNHHYHFRKIAIWELMHVSATLEFLTVGRPVGSIHYVKDNCSVIFSFVRDGEQLHFTINLDHTPCNFGGCREWFLCPKCGRRCGTLYLHGHFACHKCYDVLYGSQSDEREDRFLIIAQKISKRLGGTANITKPLPDKPKWMHHKTFWRLSDAYHTALDWHCVLTMAKYGLLDKIMKSEEKFLPDLSELPTEAEIMQGANYFETDDPTP